MNGISGAHVLIYSADADADRAFVRDVLQFPSVDVGGGWLIFGLPPAEVAVHPADAGAPPDGTAHPMLGAHLYLMCDDVRALVASLAAKGVSCSDLHTERWGIRCTIRMPSGGELGVYEPTHPTAIQLKSS